MMSRPVPAPRTHAGKQVAKCSLEKVTTMPEVISASSQRSISSIDSSLEKNKKNDEVTGQPQSNQTLTRPTGATDLNLTNLITEVERDIWLLEQLENNSSTKRALRNPLELPFPVTEEILSLPGYKPGRRKNVGEGKKPDIPLIILQI